MFESFIFQNTYLLWLTVPFGVALIGLFGTFIFKLPDHVEKIEKGHLGAKDRIQKNIFIDSISNLLWEIRKQKIDFENESKKKHGTTLKWHISKLGYSPRIDYFILNINKGYDQIKKFDDYYKFILKWSKKFIYFTPVSGGFLLFLSISVFVNLDPYLSSFLILVTVILVAIWCILGIMWCRCFVNYKFYKAGERFEK